MSSIRAALLLAAVLLVPTVAVSQGLSPEEALKKMKVAPGFEVSITAAEPLIRQPLSMSFDDRGRLWVLQYLQYPSPAGLKPVKIDQYLRVKYDRVPEPPPKGPKGVDRITILSDPDEKGRFRKSKDFLADLNLASGFCLGHGGVWVAQPPYLLFYPDRNGDDVPDGPPEVHLSGFGMDDSHSFANSLQWGPDGWLYGAAGSTSYSDVCGYKFCQGIWRYHPTKKKFELFSEGGGNTYGLDFDRQGNVIAGTNWGGFAMLHQHQGAYYIKGFAKHGPLANPHAYGYFPHVPYKGVFKGGHVTCGGIVYHGGAFPKEFEGTYIAGNLLSNDIYWHVMEKDGSTFKARHGGELLQSNDPWFRPVDCIVGPDGAVYIADWHDKRAAHLDPRDNWDKTNGRIYRIGYKGGASLVEKVRELQKRPLSKCRSDWLIDLLSDDNDWFRREARRILATRTEAETWPSLRRMALGNFPGNFRDNIEAAWTVLATGNVPGHAPDHFVEKLLRHPREEIRFWAVRHLGDERKVNPTQCKLLLEMARHDKSPLVRSQLACTAGRLPGAEALPLIVALLQRDEDVNDQHIPMLLWWAIETHTLSSRNELLQMFEDPQAWSCAITRQFIIERLARRYAAEGKDEDWAACATLLRQAPTSADENMVLRGVEQGLGGRRLDTMPASMAQPLADLHAKHPNNPVLLKLSLGLHDQPVVQASYLRAADAKRPERERAQLIELLGPTHRFGWISLLLEYLIQSKSPMLRSAALSALQQHDDPCIPEAVLQVYPTLPADQQVKARTLLASRSTFALALLKAVDSGAINPKDIPLADARQMSGFKNAELGKLLEKHFGRLTAATAGEKQNKIGYFRYAIGRGKGDAGRGAVLFEKNCANCHTLFGKGEKIGPDLTGADRKNREFMLLHVVDPSAAQRLEYANQIVTTTDGRTLTGVIVEATPEAIVLADVKAQKTRLLRAQIEEMTSSPVSAMPEGLLDPLDDQQVRDLFAYIQSEGAASGGRPQGANAPRSPTELASGGRQPPEPAKKKGALPPLKVCLVSGSVEYKSDESLDRFQKYLEANYNITCSRAFRTTDTDLPGLENLEKCDVLLLYTRRLQIDGEQLERVKKYCQAGKPIVALRTASHAFQKWLALDKEILGGNYKNHYKEGPTTEVKIEEKAKNHPTLKGVKPFTSVASLYKNTGIANDCELLMTGTIPDHTEPLTWTREVNKGRIFYTSLGHLRDFENENFVRLLVNALYWTARREVPE